MGVVIHFAQRFQPRRRQALRELAVAMLDTFAEVANERIDMRDGNTTLTAYRDGRITAWSGSGESLLLTFKRA